MGIRAHDAVKGRAFYVLVLIVALNMIYPITSGGNIIALLVFQVLYAGLFAVGIIITSDNRKQVAWSVSIAGLWLIFAVGYAFHPEYFWWSMITYFILGMFYASITWVL